MDGGGEPKALVFPTPEPAGGNDPRPLDFGHVTTDWITPARPDKQMAEPKGLSFGLTRSTSPPADDGPRPLAMPSRPSPTPRPEQSGPGALALPPVPVKRIEVHQIGQPTRYVEVPEPEPLSIQRMHQRTAPPSREAIIGGDPRAPALMEKAKAVNTVLASHRLFRNRLEAFLDLRPSMWVTWGEADLRVLVNSASKQAELTRKLSLANAVKWAGECEQAYKKPPNFIDRLTAPKPAFFQERLTQARDVLIGVSDEVARLLTDLKPRLENISIDTLVIQVATTDVADQNDQITASRRHQTLVGAMQTGAMIVQGLEALAGTVSNQSVTVGDLLSVTIPNWILAQSKA